MSTSKAKGYLFLASSLCDGLEDKDIKQVRTLLLNKDANPNTLIPTYGVAPFHLVIGNDSEAFAEEVTKLFLRHGGNPNIRSVDGLTPVHVAAAWGRVTVLELLLANGGDPLSMDDEGRSPFHYAFDGKYYKAIVILGKYCESTTKDEMTTQYKITFDKLLVSSGNVVAEYTAPQTPAVRTEKMLNGYTCKGHKNGRFDIKHKPPSFKFYDNRANTDNQFDISVAELQIREEIDKEKFLVNKIINQLSNSLKSNPKEIRNNNEYEQSEQIQYDSSPSSTLSTDSSIAYSMKDKFALKVKARKRSTTPKYRRRAFGPNSSRIPLIPAYNPSDSIISKSPNFVINKSAQDEQRYLSPKVLNKESKYKAFTPCMTRKQSFRSEEFSIRKEVARSTPRRKKRLYRQYSFNRKLRRNDDLTSPENTSPESMNSLSPDSYYIRESNYKFNKNLAIKLHESKYDDDIPKESNENTGFVEPCAISNDVMEGLDNNFASLKLKNNNFKGKNKEDSREYIAPDRLSNGEIELNASSANTFKENLNSLLSSFKSQTCISVEEEYKYENVEEGVAFLERRIYTLPPCKNSDCTSANSQWPQSLNLSMNMSLTDETLREKLINLGDNPGPITNTTRQLYLKRLTSLKNGKRNSALIQINRSNPLSNVAHCEYRTKPSLIYGDWVNDLGRYKIIEKNTFKEFCLVSPSRKWREGMNKTCFNYLLLDPRLTRDLPSRVETLSKSTIWSMFLSAIFYVGKGTRNRPYFHLKDSFDAWVSNRNPDSSKIQQILSVWNEGYGVVCLHVFQNSIPVEAYTREAAMIDALGLQTLRNNKCGDYYGIAATWNKEEKCNFGRYLLHQALQIFLHEGERQIFPQNL